MSASNTKVPPIYGFSVKDLHNNDFELSKFHNKHQLLLIVNFATNDELAEKNFLELRDIKQKFRDGNEYFFVIQ